MYYKGFHTYHTLLLMTYSVLAPMQSTAHYDIFSNFFICPIAISYSRGQIIK